jgi:hypothetical protein
MTFDPRVLPALLDAYVSFVSSRPHGSDGVRARELPAVFFCNTLNM